MSRMSDAADASREEALLHRIGGSDEIADALDARADELDSGTVTDRTDEVIGMFRAVLGR